MEFFSKAKVVKLRSHLDKYLVPDGDGGKVRQSRKGSVKRAQWTVEPGKNHNMVRLKSCNGKYLTATETPFMLGMTGKTVILTELEAGLDGKNEWEPIRDGFQVKMKSWCGKYLRGNGGTPPWRNTVTHDDPHSSATKDWILWDIESVLDEEVDDFSESVLSSFASDDVFVGSEPPSPMSVFSLSSPPPARWNSQLQVRVLFWFRYFFFDLLAI